MTTLIHSSLLPPNNGVIELNERPSDDQLFRVIEVYPNTNHIVLFGLGRASTVPTWMEHDRIVLGLRTGEVTVSREDPSRNVVPQDSRLSDSAKRERDRRLNIIQPLVNDPDHLILRHEYRGALISARAKEVGIRRNKIYSYLARWWRHGQIPNTLSPAYENRGDSGERLHPGSAKRGAPRRDLHLARGPGINVDVEIKEKLLTGVRYLKMGMSYYQAYEEVLQRQFRTEKLVDGAYETVLPDKSHLPTFRQFTYWISRALRPGELLHARLGEAKAERNHRPRLGTARDAAFGPGSVYQIDATVGNFYLRSNRYPDRIIGRPVIYIVVDHYSHLIVGFHVDLTGPCWESAKMALEMAFTEKVSFCSHFGIDIDEGRWPHGLCSTLTGDRGWENLCESAKQASLALNYNVLTLPPYRPDYKGLVEGKFEMLDHQQIKWMAGATHPLSRGDVKHKLDMVHTIKSFTKAMIHWILLHNDTQRLANPPSNYHSSTGANPSPLEVWNHGLLNVGTVRTLDRSIIRANLLHCGTARETDKGLKFNQLFYVPTNNDVAVNFTRTPKRAWRSLSVRYDPRDVSKILLPAGGSTFHEFTLSPNSIEYEGYTLQEVQDDMRQKKTANEAQFSDDLNKKMIHRHEQKAIEAEARAEAGAHGAVARMPSANRQERRAVHRENQRANAWTSSNLTEVPQAPLASPREAPQQIVSTPVRSPSHLAVLQAARANQRRLLEETQE